MMIVPYLIKRGSLINLYHANGVFLYPQPPNPHEIIKPEVFWCFQGLRKEISSTMMMMMMMMMMMNFFCGLVDRRKTFSLISSQAHRQRSSPLRIFDTPRVGFEPAQNLSSGLVE